MRVWGTRMFQFERRQELPIKVPTAYVGQTEVYPAFTQNQPANRNLNEKYYMSNVRHLEIDLLIKRESYSGTYAFWGIARSDEIAQGVTGRSDERIPHYARFLFMHKRKNGKLQPFYRARNFGLRTGETIGDVNRIFQELTWSLGLNFASEHVTIHFRFIYITRYGEPHQFS